jgi:hypothetical protein
MTYCCPVCGYDNLSKPPNRYSICPCCGTEFENDDFLATHEELRRAWVEQGAQWWSKRVHPPVGWSAGRQLDQAGYRVEAARLGAGVTEAEAIR